MCSILKGDKTESRDFPASGGVSGDFPSLAGGGGGGGGGSEAARRHWLTLARRVAFGDIFSTRQHVCGYIESALIYARLLLCQVGRCNIPYGIRERVSLSLWPSTLHYAYECRDGVLRPLEPCVTGTAPATIDRTVVSVTSKCACMY